VVHGTHCDNNAGRYSAIWVHLHRDVLHLHIVLGVQDLLRVRVHAAGVHHPDDRDHLRDHCVHVLLAERGGLPLAVDELPGGRQHRLVRVPLLLLLLPVQDQDVRAVPDGLLLRLHGSVQCGTRSDVRHRGLRGHQPVRQEDIFHCQD